MRNRTWGERFWRPGSWAMPVLVLALAASLILSCAVSGDPELDRAWLDQVEDLSESLANDLLALSVALRDRDWETVAGYFDDTVTGTAFPSEPAPAEPVEKWIEAHGWVPPAGIAGSSWEREAYLEQWRRFLDHFSQLEDVRLKVKFAEFDPHHPDRGTASVKGFFIARDDQGRREWVKPLFSIEARRAPGDPPRWKIRRLEVESLRSKLASTDLFHEVALPAGVAAVFPPFGTGSNQGFVAHGAAAGDLDGDGWLDLVATGTDQNYLYRNLGDGRFQDLSRESMLAFAPPGSGVVLLDYDRDGDLDVFMARVGEQGLFENRFVPDGVLRFKDVSVAAGVTKQAVGFSTVAADVNADGFTDVYVASYNRYGTIMPNSWGRATNGTPNLLFLNQGDGTFVEAAAAWGVDDSRWTYAAGFADLDEDGDQDLYVANDFGENAFYLNQGDRFEDVAEAWGIVDPGFGMGVSFGDYDNDGDLDLHVTNMSSTAGNRILKRLYPERRLEHSLLARMAAGNSLYENLGGGRFKDVTESAGPFPAGWAFGGGFLDLDNDGWEDLYTPNGFISGKSMKDT